jgi:hypothetical protein
MRSDNLSAEDQIRLAAMVALREQWAAVDRSRLAALVRAASHTMTGLLTVRDVCQALQISEATWHRWCRDLGLRELARDCVAEVDRALRSAGADETTTVEDVKADPDLALAVGAVGVWPREEGSTRP